MLAERPWRRALREERVKPSGVMGPWDLAPLMRAVEDFSGVITDICVVGLWGERRRWGTGKMDYARRKWLEDIGFSLTGACDGHI